MAPTYPNLSPPMPCSSSSFLLAVSQPPDMGWAPLFVLCGMGWDAMGCDGTGWVYFDPPVGPVVTISAHRVIVGGRAGPPPVLHSRASFFGGGGWVGWIAVGSPWARGALGERRPGGVAIFSFSNRMFSDKVGRSKLSSVSRFMVAFQASPKARRCTCVRPWACEARCCSLGESHRCKLPREQSDCCYPAKYLKYSIFLSCFTRVRSIAQHQGRAEKALPKLEMPTRLFVG